MFRIILRRNMALIRTRPLALSSVRFSASTSEENPDKTSSSEASTQQYEFQAETRQLLDIVARSLYSENEVFIRELVSNASDALNKRKFEQLQLGQEPPSLDIHISVQKSNNRLIIQDNGVGMTKEECIDNLGTIARSGSKAFIDAVKEQEGSTGQSIIGQFGVGFYSSFMVADKVEVFTRKWDSDQGYHWTSTGEGGYELVEAENVDEGTKIVINLKPECRKFSNPEEVKQVCDKYSSFTQFPLMVDNDRVNKMDPLWMMESNQITDEMHHEFYTFLSNDKQEPRFRLYYKTEMPIMIRSIFYVPKNRPAMGIDLTSEQKSEVSLYCRKVLIQNKTDMILPPWLRFVRGVVDSEDVPLNLSRELLQNSDLITKIRQTLTSRLVKFLNDKAKRAKEEYTEFYREHKMFVAEGILTEQNSLQRDEIARLLRYESTATDSGEYTSLDDYIARMGEDQRYIFYLAANNRRQAESSPYLEAVREKGYEVLFMVDPYDEIMVQQMQRFKDKTLFSIENDIIQEDEIASKKEETKLDESIPQLTQNQQLELKEWAKSFLGRRASKVEMTSKLQKQPAMVNVWQLGMVRNFIRMERAKNPDAQMTEEQVAEIVEPSLQLSTSHPVILKMYELLSTDAELAELVLDQLYSAGMANAGLTEDAISIANKTTIILEQFLKKLDAIEKKPENSEKTETTPE